MSAFEELGVFPEIIQAIEEMDWLLPTPIQSEAIPLILGGGDVLAAAETGSGKTGSFAIPLLQIAHEIRRGVSTQGNNFNNFKKNDPFPFPIILNVKDRDSVVAISQDGLLCQSREEKKWGGCRSSIGLSSGLWYYEAIVTDEGLCRVGFSTKDSSYELGTDSFSFGYGGTGKKSFNRNFTDYGYPFGLNDVIGCYLDFDQSEISFSKNGKFLGIAFSIPTHLANIPLYPSVVLKNAEISFNFGNRPFKYPPELGYMPINQATVGHSHLFFSPSSSSVSSPIGVILEPTRELAQQVSSEITRFKQYLSHPTISHTLLIGGQDMKDYLNVLKRGVDIVIATPGIFSGMVKNNKIDISTTNVLILDEADKLVDSGTLPDIMTVYQKISHNIHRQVSMFSATLHSNEVKELAEKITRHPTWVDLKGKNAVPETVDHAVIYVDSRFDSQWMSNIPHLETDGVHYRDKIQNTHLPESVSEGVKRLKPLALLKVIEAFKMDQCLIFCRTKVDCDNLEKFLIAMGGGKKFTGKTNKGIENIYSCLGLHSGKSNKERKENFQSFKDGDVRFLICTDIAARGIDIKELPYVINMCLPDKSEDYIHRIGRVGRADYMGLAISIVSQVNEKVWYHQCPSRGANCNNTRLLEQGGCCIWYNELECQKAIEKRLNNRSLEVLDIKNLVKGREKFAQTYGQQRNDEIGDTALAHLQYLQPKTRQLAQIEEQSQHSYLSFQTRWLPPIYQKAKK